MSDAKNMTWDRENANEFTLWNGDDLLCRIKRSYHQRLSSSLASYECNDTSKPMVWTIVRPGRRSRRLGALGMTAREAKAVAESLMERFGLV